MSIEVLNTIFAGGTFIVIAVTAIAATIQLRHIRSGNQLLALTTVLNGLRDRDFQEWLRFSVFDLPSKLEDGAFRESLTHGPVDRVLHKEFQLGDYFEQVGAFVKNGLIDGSTLIDAASGIIIRAYTAARPAIELLREREKSDALYENFEYLATRCQMWMDRHPQGAYPAGFPRFAEVTGPEFDGGLRAS